MREIPSAGTESANDGRDKRAINELMEYMLREKRQRAARRAICTWDEVSGGEAERVVGSFSASCEGDYFRASMLG